MQVVLSKPWDDDSIVEVYIIENEKVTRNKLASQFEKDWEKIRVAVIKKEPETWMVSQVIDLLEKKMGWQILHVSDPVMVTY